MILTAVDVEFGPICTACRKELHEGDEVFGEWTGMIGDAAYEEDPVCLDCKEKQL